MAYQPKRTDTLRDTEEFINSHSEKRDKMESTYSSLNRSVAEQLRKYFLEVRSQKNEE